MNYFAHHTIEHTASLRSIAFVVAVVGLMAAAVYVMRMVSKRGRS